MWWGGEGVCRFFIMIMTWDVKKLIKSNPCLVFMLLNWSYYYESQDFCYFCCSEISASNICRSTGTDTSFTLTVDTDREAWPSSHT